MVKYFTINWAHEDMSYSQAVDYASRVLDGIGVAIILLGTLAALAVYARKSLDKSRRRNAYHDVRQQIGWTILLGLEFLVAGDIIRTVATVPTFENVAVLGLIVLIRTFLGIALLVEIDNRWPWRKEAAG